MLKQLNFQVNQSVISIKNINCNGDKVKKGTVGKVISIPSWRNDIVQIRFETNTTTPVFLTEIKIIN